jgi:hypothetical protein
LVSGWSAWQLVSVAEESATAVPKTSSTDGLARFDFDAFPSSPGQEFPKSRFVQAKRLAQQGREPPTFPNSTILWGLPWKALKAMFLNVKSLFLNKNDK